MFICFSDSIHYSFYITEFHCFRFFKILNPTSRFKFDFESHIFIVAFSNPLYVYVCMKKVCNFKHLAKTPFAQNHEEVEIVQPDSAFARVQCSGSRTQSRRGHSRNRLHHSNRRRRNRGHDSSIWYLQK